MSKLSGRQVQAVKKDSLRVYLSMCVGKIIAYHRLKREDDASFWAKKLVAKLEEMGLL